MRWHTELTLPLGTLLGEDMTQVGLGALELTLSGAAKTFRRPTVGFHLGHYLLLGLARTHN
jgi:hypothetical protein